MSRCEMHHLLVEGAGVDIAASASIPNLVLSFEMQEPVVHRAAGPAKTQARRTFADLIIIKAGGSDPKASGARLVLVEGRKNGREGIVSSDCSSCHVDVTLHLFHHSLVQPALIA